MPRLRSHGSSLGAFLLISFLFLLFVISCSSETLTLEERAQSIDKQLMCPVCPAETIDQSQAELAVQMRALVRQKVQAGETKDQILAFFVESYGESVLSRPPSQGFNILVWVVPPLALIGGLALVWMAVRQLGQRRPVPRAAGPQAPSQALAPYLAKVDAEFLAFERARASNDAPGGEGRPDQTRRE